MFSWMARGDRRTRWWDEYRGPKDNERPHPITLGELYTLLAAKGIRSRNLFRPQTPGAPRKSVKGFYWAQFTSAWAALGVTPPQSNKVITLHRHTTRRTD